MPRMDTVLTVFVASPSDVAEERDRVESAVEEINRTHGRTTAIRFEIIRWEKDVRAGIGVDSQSVINRQIPDDYDVFLGIMWARFGTPTSRAGSGTEEEFNDAYSRFENQTSPPEIMLYFKKAPVPFDKIDENDISKVRKFRERCKKDGVLYYEFETGDELEKYIRAHFTKLMNEHKNRPIGSSGTSAKSSRQEPANPTLPNQSGLYQSGLYQSGLYSGTNATNGNDSGNDSGELGLFELVEIAEANLTGAVSALDSIGSALSTLTEKIYETTSEIEAIDGSQDKKSKQKMRLSIKSISEEMERFVKTNEIHLDSMEEKLNAGIQATLSGSLIFSDFGAEGLDEIENVIESQNKLADSIRHAKGGVLGLRDSVVKLPRLTRELNVAKRNISDFLQKILDILSFNEKIIEENQDNLNNEITRLRKIIC